MRSTLRLSLFVLSLVATRADHVRKNIPQRKTRTTTTCGALTYCYLYEIDTASDIAIVDNRIVLPKNTQQNNYSVRCDTTIPMQRVSFTENGIPVRTEYFSPYFMAGDRGGTDVRPVSSLHTCGTEIVVTAFRGLTTCWSTTLRVECPPPPLLATLPPPLPGKRGAAFTLREEGRSGSWTVNLPKIVALDPYWSYSWGSNRIEAFPDTIEFVPMLWGGNNVADRIAETIMPQVMAGQAKRVLGFNEPDKKAQANMPVERAVTAWNDVKEALGDKVSLVSPSAESPGKPWMQSFMAAPGVIDSIDWVGVHWYSNPNFPAFKRKMEEWHVMYGNRPLLITEFAVADWEAKTVAQNRHSPSAVLAFMKQALPWLEATPWIAGYVWFSYATTSVPGTSSALVDLDGNLTQLGRFYSSVRTETPMGDVSIF